MTGEGLGSNVHSPASRSGGPRVRLYTILESPGDRDPLNRIVDVGLVLLIALNVGAVVLETVEAIGRTYAELFYAFEALSVLVFTAEYGLRVWVSVEKPQAASIKPWRARLRYMVTPLALIDLLAVAPFYLATFIGVDLRFMRLFRLLRILKLTRHSAALSMVGTVIYSERRALTASVTVMLVLLVVASGLMYFAERRAQPEAFASIPHAMWWGVATLTTVGFGDVTPVTPVGKVLGAVAMLLGIGMFAMPAGILASGFSQEIKSRDFVIEWRMVAKVPVFGRLEASLIADIVTMLKPQVAIQGEVIVREGEQADCMYFIASGECEVDVSPKSAILGPGDFFGAIESFKHDRRHATVRARTTCQLLMLTGDDFDDLLGRSENLNQAIMRIVNDSPSHQGHRKIGDDADE